MSGGRVLLYRIWVKSLLRRFRYRLVDHLVVGLCATVLIAVTLYMFSDFVGQRLSIFSFQDRARTGVSVALSLLTALGLLQGVRRGRLRRGQLYALGSGVPHSFWAWRQGVAVRDITVFLAQRALSLLVIVTVVGGVVIYGALRPRLGMWPWMHGLGCLIATLLGCALYPMSLRVREDNTPERVAAGASSSHHSELAVVASETQRALHRVSQPLTEEKLSRPSKSQWQVRWRWKARLFSRLYPPSAALMISALISCLVIGGCVIWQGHIIELFAAALLPGLLAATALCTLEAECARTGIYERIAGTSHGAYMGALWLLSAAVSASMALGVLVALTVSHAVVGLNVGPGLSGVSGLVGVGGGGGASWVPWLQLSSIAALPPLLVPGVLFQIHPQRVGLNVLMIALISVFVATGIVAHILTLAALPVLLYVVYSASEGGYYRKS